MAIIIAIILDPKSPKDWADALQGDKDLVGVCECFIFCQTKYNYR